MTTKAEPARLAIWDAPTRLFHWVLAVLIGVMWWTGEEGMLDWHRIAGYSVISLLLFRFVWGFVGSSTARFGNFVRSPRSVANYVCRDMLLRDSAPKVGHNPLGGWGVIAMLSLLAFQCLLGLFSVDVDGLESGPFSYLVEFDTGRFAAELHAIVFNVLLAVVALHLFAVFFYLVRCGQNLIGPMVSGHRPWSGEIPTLVRMPLWRGLAIFAGCGLAVFVTVALFGQA